MTAIVTGTDGRLYVHQMAGEAPVFVTEALEADAAPPVGHARLVAWLVPVEPGGTERARVRLPTGPIVEVAAEAVCNASNIAKSRIQLAGQQALFAPRMGSPQPRRDAPMPRRQEVVRP